MDVVLPQILSVSNESCFEWHDLGIPFINQHIHALRDFFREEELGPLSLDDEHFWHNLPNEFAQNGEKLRALWQKVRFCAHRSSSELLSLLTRLGEMESQLNLSIAELKAAQRLEQEQFFKFSNKIPELHGLEIAFQSNLEVLCSLKKKGTDALVARSLMARDFKTPSHEDDPVYVIFEQLKQVDKIKKSSRQSQPLSDDDRMALYDLLEYEKADLGSADALIQPIRKIPFTPPQKADQINQEEHDWHRKCDLIQDKIRLLIQSKKSQKSHTADAFKLPFWIPEFLVSLVWGLYSYRVIVAQVLLLTLYAWCLPALSLVFGLYLNELAASILSKTVFLGFMSPTLLWANKAFSGVWTRLRDSMSLPTRQLVYDATRLFENNLALMKRLAIGVLDTPAVDLDRIANDIERAHGMLALIEKELGKLTRTQGWLSTRDTQKALTSSKKMFVKQKVSLKSKAENFCAHLVQRYEQDLVLLQLDANQGLIPSLKMQQRSSIEGFIKQYGKEEDLLKFQELNCLLRPFQKSLLSEQFLVQKALRTKVYPWGEYEQNQGSLKGWRHLMMHGSSLSEDVCQKVFLFLLKGKESDLEAFSALINTQLSSEFKSALQHFLFKTLNQYPAQTVALLSGQHHEVIRAWYQAHKEKVDQAHEWLDRFFERDYSQQEQYFKKHDPQKLAEVVSLLEGESWVRMLDEKREAHHRVKDVIDRYDGSSADVIAFIRFFQPAEREGIMVKLASMRLEFFLENPTECIISLQDEAMFHSEYLKQSDFDFGRKILQHTWERLRLPEMKQLIQKFEDAGFISKNQLSCLDNITLNSRSQGKGRSLEKTYKEIRSF